MADDAPIPKNIDDRPRDIIRDQVAKVDSQDPISSIESILPKEEIVSVPPPFPAFPSSNNFQAPDLYETARSVIADIFKNVTINGASPSSTGTGFNFDLNIDPPAHLAFSILNPIREATVLPPETPPVATPETPPVTPISEVPEVQLERTPSGVKAWDDLQNKAIGSNERRESGLPLSQSLDTTPMMGPKLDRAHTEADGSVLNQTAETSRQEGTHAMPGGVGRHNSGGGSKPSGEDMLGRKRLHNETKGQYRDRMEVLKNVKSDPEAVAAISNGDTSYFYKGMVPVLLTRGDTGRKILGYIDQSFSGVVEGAVAGERPASLPAPSAYYIGGLPSGCPYDFYAKLEGSKPTEASFLAAIKHKTCSETGVGDGVFERYAGLSAEPADAGYWAYFGESADWNVKAIATETNSTLQLFDSSSGNYFAALVKDDESSLWGYTSAWQYLIQATGGKADIQLFSVAEDGYAEMYAYSGNTGFSCSNTDDIYSTLEPSSLLLSENDNVTNLWAEGLTITDGTNTISVLMSQIDGHDIAFREMEICGGRSIMVLCSAPYATP